MFTILRHADVYTPKHLGLRDVLIAGGKVLAIGPNSRKLRVDYEEIDLNAQRLSLALSIAMFISRAVAAKMVASQFPLALSSLFKQGDLVYWCLGYRWQRAPCGSWWHHARFARTSLSAWCYTGSYQYPPITLTGSVRDDIVYVDPIVGVGEFGSATTALHNLRSTSSCASFPMVMWQV